MPDNLPYKDINEPASDKGDEQQAPGNDEQVLSLVRKCFESAKNARKEFDQDWDKYKDFYNGKQWDTKRASYKASPNMNIVRSVVQTELPILTDTDPQFTVSPMEPMDYQFSEVVNKLVDVWWQRRQMRNTLIDSIWDALVVSTGILKTTWNEDIEGVGDVLTKRVDPKNIYVPDGALDFDKECGYVIEEIWMPTNELRMKFPEYAKKLSGTAGSTETDKALQTRTYSGAITLQSPTDRDVGVGFDKESGGISQYKKTRIWECWLDDDTLVEYSYDDNGEQKQGQKKKYPRGRLITVAPDAKLVLQDVENPYIDGRKPYVRVALTTVPGQFWAEGDVGPLLEAQKLLNKTSATIVNWMNVMSNNVWLLDSNSGVSPNQITNQVGLVLVKNPNSTVTRLDAPNCPSDLFEFYNLLMSLIDQQSGIHDVTQGRKPTGITAAEAINQLQEAAQTRIRIKERMLQTSLVQLGYQVVSRMLQYYTLPRVVKVSGQQEWPEFFEFFTNQDEEGNFVANTRKYLFQPEDKEYVPAGDWSQTQPSRGEFDITVQAGTALPFAKSQRSSLAFRLFEGQAIDQEALLKAVEFPDYEEIMTRMTQAQPPAAPPGAAPPMAPPGAPQ